MGRQPIMEIAAELAMGPASERRELGGGLLNETWLLSDDGRHIVVRQRRETAPSDVLDYLQGLFRSIRLDELGGRFHLRTLGEEASFILELLAAGVRTPHLIAMGRDWLALDFVHGETLASALSVGRQRDGVLDLLRQLQLAHARGLVIGDRWGGNEIVDEEGQVSLIDFDVALVASRAGHRLAELDVVGAVFGVLASADPRADVCDHVREFAIPALAAWNYDLQAIADLLDRYFVFYTSGEKPETSLSRPRSHYAALRSDLHDVASALRSG